MDHCGRPGPAERGAGGPRSLRLALQPGPAPGSSRRTAPLCGDRPTCRARRGADAAEPPQAAAYARTGQRLSSTLRRSLGVLLGIELRCTASGRLVFGPEGEAELNRWMAEHARVCWWEHESPWTAERALIERLDFPLNLAGNASHPFHPRLTALRARAAAEARSRPPLG
ncbi:GIY-YIG nuclease family protein [Streptomyces sp. NPDC047046]|uniref:GIY-YIG nuclease family protein n=1 Tax=Streptomyces sp. NPDC047046 TaxID=3155378 RepID=UPI0033CF7CDC